MRVPSKGWTNAIQGIWNAEQEKTSTTTTASYPIMTQMANSSLDAAKNMPGTMPVEYATVMKWLTAAQALGVVVLHEKKRGKDRQGDAEKAAADKVKEQEEQEAQLKLKAEGEKLAGLSISTPAEIQLTSTTYKMLGTRTSTAEPNTLRESVEIKEKSIEQLFEDRQKGRKVVIPGDTKTEKDFTAIVGGPEVVKIISSLGSTKENEISGAHRHLRELQHPTKGGKLPKPSADAEKRLDMVAKLVGKTFAASAEREKVHISYYSAPAKWTEEMKAEAEEKATQALQAGTDPHATGTCKEGWLRKWQHRLLKGFVKTDELQLPLTKHSRLIGDLGTTANMEDAMSIGPLENLMKKCYPHLITKKLTLLECDDAMSNLLLDMKKKGLKPESDDYSAMDSSWTLNDRRRLRGVATAALKPIEQYLRQQLRNFDHVLDADQHVVAGRVTKDGQVQMEKRKIKWQLAYITLLMSPQDAILFSGERMTSLMNRWLVLMLEFAEDLRCLGEIEGTKAILATLAGKRRNTIGDGDDNLQGIIPDRYKNKEERINRFAEYYKLLDVCSAEDETTDAEVLSRYHILVGKNEYIHIGKLNRNMGRLIAFKIKRPNSHEDETTTSLTQPEVQMICTDIWQRIISLKSTMVVRHFARAVFLRFYMQIRSWDAGTVYSDDDKRRGLTDGDKTLAECLSQINEALASAPTSTYAMVKVSHFKNMKTLTPKQILKLRVEWKAADEMLSEAEISDQHMLYPHTFFEDFPISSGVSRALGLSDECINVALRREQSLEPPAMTGKLVDMHHPSSTGSVGNTHADPASETADISHVAGAGVPSGVYVNSAGVANPNVPNVHGALRSGLNKLLRRVRKQDGISADDDALLPPTLEPDTVHTTLVASSITEDNQKVEPVQVQALGAGCDLQAPDVLEPHGAASSPPGESTFTCAKCFKMFKHTEKRRRDEQDFCPGCDLDVQATLSMLEHMQHEHEIGEIRSNICKLQSTGDFLAARATHADNPCEDTQTGFQACSVCSGLMAGAPSGNVMCESCQDSLLKTMGMRITAPDFVPGAQWQSPDCECVQPPPKVFETTALHTMPPLNDDLCEHILTFKWTHELVEIEGDLFTAGFDYCLAHCVAQDLRMSAGIAKQFRSKFGMVEVLRAQHPRVGEVASLPPASNDRGSTIYYLVTKRYSNHKPTVVALEKSLCALRDSMVARGETLLAIPRLGSGLDNLPWPLTKLHIKRIFANTHIKIVVYTPIKTPSPAEATPAAPETAQLCLAKHLLKQLRIIRAREEREANSPQNITPEDDNALARDGHHSAGNIPVLRAASPTNNNSMAVVGRVERGLARTKCIGQQGNVAERQGNNRSPDEVQDEPPVSPKTSTAPPGLLVEGDSGHQVAGGSRHSHTAIVCTGSKTHGAKQADRRDGGRSDAQASDAVALPAGSIACEPRCKATRRGNKHNTSVAAASSSNQQEDRDVAAPPRTANGSSRVWVVKTRHPPEEE